MNSYAYKKEAKMASEKEFNFYLFEQLEIVEDCLELLNENPEQLKNYLEKKKRQIERKLYQKPPLYESN